MKKYVIGVAFAVGLLAALPAPKAQSVTTSMWGGATIPTGDITDQTNTAAESLGNKFVVNTSGVITQLKFYKSSADTSTASRNLILWNSSGTNVAQCSTGTETTGSNQWVACNVTYPVSSGTTLYVTVDYASGEGHYFQLNSGQCADAIVGQNWLTCDHATGDNNYHSAATGSFPNAQYSGFIADVVFCPV